MKSNAVFSACMAVVLLCAGMVFSHAQETPFVNIRFSVLSFGSAARDIYYFDNGLPKAISVYQTDITGPHAYKGPPVLSFFRKGPADADGNPTWIPLAQVSLAMDARQLLLLFYKDTSASAERYVITPINATDAGFKPSQLKLFNFTSLTVGGKFGEKTFQLLPSKTQVFSYPAEKTFETAVMLRLAADREDGWKLVFSKPFTCVPDTRRWIFIVEMPSVSGGIQILPFLERIKVARPPENTIAPAEVSSP